ncbi:hypothetical protein RCL1_006899 [Eukaryota sp. TZLM3-RCL]
MIKGSLSSSAHLRLTDVQAESVSSFLKEHFAYVRYVGAENALSMQDCIDNSLLSCFTLLCPLIKKSDSELKKYLESLIGYSSIEEVYLAFDGLVMDNSIPDPQARVFKLLQDFMDVQRRSKVATLTSKRAASTLKYHFKDTTVTAKDISNLRQQERNNLLKMTTPIDALFNIFSGD